MQKTWVLAGILVIAMCALTPKGGAQQKEKKDAAGHEWFNHAVFYEIYPARGDTEAHREATKRKQFNNGENDAVRLGLANGFAGDDGTQLLELSTAGKNYLHRLGIFHAEQVS